MATRSKFFQKFDNSAVCWSFSKIFASWCDKLFIFSDKNQNVCKSVTTVRKDSGYQFLFKVTHLKFSNVQEIWQLHCLLTFSDNFLTTMCKSLKTVRKDPAYQFLCTATQSKFWEKLTTWSPVNIFKRFLHHSVTNCLYF